MTPETAQLGLDKLDEAINTKPRKWEVTDWPDVSRMGVFCPSSAPVATQRDVQKDNWLVSNDFYLIEVNYDEVDKLSKAFFEKQFNVIL